MKVGRRIKNPLNNSGVANYAMQKKGIWLVKNSHMTSNIQSEYIILGLHSYSTMKFVYDIQVAV